MSTQITLFKMSAVRTHVCFDESFTVYPMVTGCAA